MNNLPYTRFDNSSIFQQLATIRTTLAHWMSFVPNQEVL